MGGVMRGSWTASNKALRQALPTIIPQEQTEMQAIKKPGAALAGTKGIPEHETDESWLMPLISDELKQRLEGLVKQVKKTLHKPQPSDVQNGKQMQAAVHPQMPTTPKTFVEHSSGQQPPLLTSVQIHGMSFNTNTPPDYNSTPVPSNSQRAIF